MPIFIDHLKLTFMAPKPPPSHVFEHAALMAAHLMITGSGSLSSFSLCERVSCPCLRFVCRFSWLVTTPLSLRYYSGMVSSLFDLGDYRYIVSTFLLPGFLLITHSITIRKTLGVFYAQSYQYDFFFDFSVSSWHKKYKPLVQGVR